jgi:hypothetical protein
MSTRFDWSDVCTTILSMQSSHTHRASVISQLGSEGISERISVSPGIVLSAETIEQVVGDAAQSCMVPPDYAASGNVSTRWFGTIGSSLAHLNLLHRFDRRRPKCSWLMVLADDVVLLPGFAEWVQRSVFTASNTNVDFVNLAVVRAWGEESGQATSKEASAVKRVSGSQDWPAWTAGRSPADAIVKSPNLLVSGYLVRMATLPVLLKSFGLTRNWRRECSIDQVLARVQYALASSGQYRAVNVEAEWSKLAHCAVGESEKQVIQKRFPDRHAACETQHKELYGSGSRSHDRRRRLSSIDDTLLMTKKKASVKNGHTQPSGACFHGFQVPGDRVTVDGEGRLVTRPLGVGGAAIVREVADEWPSRCASAMRGLLDRGLLDKGSRAPHHAQPTAAIATTTAPIPPKPATVRIVEELGLTFGHSSNKNFPQTFPSRSTPRAPITANQAQLLSSEDLELLKQLVNAKGWDEIAAAREYPQRVPQRGRRGCAAVTDPLHCCYRVSLVERMERMSAWSRSHGLPQSIDVLYPYAGVDLLNSYGLFPSAPVHVLSAYHVAYSPNAETDDPADLFAETRRCLRDAECTHIMVESAANYYRHLMCLGFRSAMSAWMEGRYFAKGIGVFPSMLMLIRLLDMDLLEVTMLRRPNERTGKRAETYHGTGFVMIVQRRSKLPSEAKPPPRQKIVYLGELYGPKTVRSFFDEVERHMTLKPFVFINKAILLNMNEPTGEGDHLIHGSFFRNELCNRGAIVGAMVQDQTGFDIYFAGDFGLKYTRCASRLQAACGLPSRSHMPHPLPTACASHRSRSHTAGASGSTVTARARRRTRTSRNGWRGRCWSYRIRRPSARAGSTSRVASGRNVGSTIGRSLLCWQSPCRSAGRITA